MKYIELSHYVKDGLISYPGMPPVEISAYMTREECGAAFGATGAAMLDQIKMVNISGTYIDAPYTVLRTDTRSVIFLWKSWLIWIHM